MKPKYKKTLFKVQKKLDKLWLQFDHTKEKIHFLLDDLHDQLSEISNAVDELIITSLEEDK